MSTKVDNFTEVFYVSFHLSVTQESNMRQLDRFSMNNTLLTTIALSVILMKRKGDSLVPSNYTINIIPLHLNIRT